MKKVIKYFRRYISESFSLFLIFLELPFLLLLKESTQKIIIDRAFRYLGYIPIPVETPESSEPKIIIELDPYYPLIIEDKIRSDSISCYSSEFMKVHRISMEYNLLEQVKKYIIWTEVECRDQILITGRLFIHSQKQQQS